MNGSKLKDGESLLEFLGLSDHQTKISSRAAHNSNGNIQNLNYGQLEEAITVGIALSDWCQRT